MKLKDAVKLSDYPTRISTEITKKYLLLRIFHLEGRRFSMLSTLIRIPWPPRRDAHAAVGTAFHYKARRKSLNVLATVQVKQVSNHISTI